MHSLPIRWGILFASLAALVAVGAQAKPASETVLSPDGKLALHFSLTAGGVPAWSADLAGQPVLLTSGLGFSELPGTGFSLQKAVRSEHQETWKPVYGERSSIPDNFREVQIILTAPSAPRLEIDLRAYNEGFALRYSFPDHHAGEMLNLGKENTEFHLPSGTFAYEEHNTEGEYMRVPAGSITPQTERPLTLEYASGVFASILEAGNVDFPRMLLRAGSSPDSMVTDNGGDASITGLSATPWRLVLTGRRAGDLLEHITFFST